VPHVASSMPSDPQRNANTGGLGTAAARFRPRLDAPGRGGLLSTPVAPIAAQPLWRRAERGERRAAGDGSRTSYWQCREVGSPAAYLLLSTSGSCSLLPGLRSATTFSRHTSIGGESNAKRWASDCVAAAIPLATNAIRDILLSWPTAASRVGFQHAPYRACVHRRCLLPRAQPRQRAPTRLSQRRGLRRLPGPVGRRAGCWTWAPASRASPCRLWPFRP